MYIFIVNPVAGNGKARHVFSTIARSDLYQQMKSNYYFTNYEGHATDIVQTIIKNNPIDDITGIIVVGGDGTLHEVVNGLGNLRIPVSFIPGGSGNDFARGSQIKGKPLRILERIIKYNQTVPYWLGHYQVGEGEARYFTNSIGFGFDAEIVRTANESLFKHIFNRLKLGRFIYVFALIKTLFQFVPFTADVEVDGKKYRFNRCWMVTLTNHPYYGGGMKIIPHAKNQGEHLPILIIHNISKWKVLALFMTVFFGKHTRYKEVTLLEGNKVNIHLKQPVSYQVDGQQGVSDTCDIFKAHEPIDVLGSKVLT